MEIVIKGNPKEIAALVLAVQEQQKEWVAGREAALDALKNPA